MDLGDPRDRARMASSAVRLIRSRGGESEKEMQGPTVDEADSRSGASSPFSSSCLLLLGFDVLVFGLVLLVVERNDADEARSPAGL